MTKTKWTLILIGAMDLLLILMHFTDYYVLILKPTGYLIPFAINIIALAIIGFRLHRISTRWIITGLALSIPILLVHGFMIYLENHNYTKINSSHNALVIEYRHFTLGETTYSYDFYRTNFGIIGKHLDDQSIRIMIPGTEHAAGMDAKNTLGLGGEDWVTEDIVRFPTLQGMKEVYLNLSDTSEIVNDIEAFIDMAENNESGESITINGNQLTIRYDELSGESWIGITSNYEENAIPSPQCSRIIADEKRGYYILEECTHQWEYLLYPITEG